MNGVILNGSASATGTQAIARAAALLRELASSSGSERTLAEISRNLGLERPTVHRILRRLVDEKLVRQNPDYTDLYFKLEAIPAAASEIKLSALISSPPTIMFPLLSKVILNFPVGNSPDGISAISAACFNRPSG